MKNSFLFQNTGANPLILLGVILVKQRFSPGSYAITVCILPQAQGRKGGVVGVHYTVPVFVQFSQGGEAVCRIFSIGKQGVVAKEFSPAVNLVIAVSVQEV